MIFQASSLSRLCMAFWGPPIHIELSLMSGCGRVDDLLRMSVVALGLDICEVTSCPGPRLSNPQGSNREVTRWHQCRYQLKFQHECLMWSSQHASSLSSMVGAMAAGCARGTSQSATRATQLRLVVDTNAGRFRTRTYATNLTV